MAGGLPETGLLGFFSLQVRLKLHGLRDSIDGNANFQKLPGYVIQCLIVGGSSSEVSEATDQKGNADATRRCRTGRDRQQFPALNPE